MNLVVLGSNVVLWFVVLFLAFLLLGALRALGLVTWRLDQLEMTRPSRIGRDGLKPGRRAPDFTLPSVVDGDISLHDFAGHKVLLVFTQAGCGPCHNIAVELNRLHERGEHQVLVINNGDAESARVWVAETQARFPVLVQEQFSISKRYEAFATPFAFLIDERGIVRSRGVVGSRQNLGYVLAGAGQKKGHDEAESDADEPKRGEHKRDAPAAGRSERPCLQEMTHLRARGPVVG
jgi:peroxiredoxin